FTVEAKRLHSVFPVQSVAAGALCPRDCVNVAFYCDSATKISAAPGWFIIDPWMLVQLFLRLAFILRR
ncbi:hypothetical protein, partial [Klebsiella variicola]|uniref:hypothetical protein n=1 Tax=Klebsiella variicola TaxID=244366 RepID=UPI0039C27A80